TPHDPAQRVERGAVRPDDEDVRPAGSRLQPHTAGIVAAVPGLFHEDRDPVIGRDLVDDVVDETADEDIAPVALANPQHALVDAEPAGHHFGGHRGRDDLIETGIDPSDVERLCY